MKSISFPFSFKPCNLYTNKINVSSFGKRPCIPKNSRIKVSKGFSQSKSSSLMGKSLKHIESCLSKTDKIVELFISISYIVFMFYPLSFLFLGEG